MSSAQRPDLTASIQVGGTTLIYNYQSHNITKRLCAWRWLLPGPLQPPHCQTQHPILVFLEVSGTSRLQDPAPSDGSLPALSVSLCPVPCPFPSPSLLQLRTWGPVPTPNPHPPCYQSLWSTARLSKPQEESPAQSESDKQLIILV